MIHPIDIDCPECGVKAGQRCENDNDVFDKLYEYSYSFDLSRIVSAHKLMEEKCVTVKQLQEQ